MVEEIEKALALQFLAQQVKLLELMQEYELDAAEVLKGVSLGIEADAHELFGAAVTALSFAEG